MFSRHSRIFKFILNLYGPYVGAGVKIEHISPDWLEVKVSMKLRWYNRNAVGTHFGGSLYSMVDPHLVLMLMQLLGDEYTVWDKAAEIDFVSPGRGKVTATMTISSEVLHTIRKNTENGKAFFPVFDLQILNEAGDLVAKIKKTLYVRKKKPSSS